MMRVVYVAGFYCLTLWSASGHVGSPNVFFAGFAGNCPVQVTIRPPATLPGVAQIDVTTGLPRVTGMLLRALPFGAEPQTAPLSVRAVLVPGTTNLFHGAVPLFGGGSYSVRVEVEHAGGGGSVLVPLSADIFQRPTMPAPTSGLLIALGAVLVAGAVALARAAAIAAVERTPELPLRVGYCGRVPRVMVITAALLGVGVFGGLARWRVMDRQFRLNLLEKQRPVEAAVHTNGTLRLLRLTAIPGSPVRTWDSLLADHGKLMHLFLLKESDLNSFAHLHPVRRDAATFEGVLPSLPGGAYQLFAEVTQTDGWSHTLTSRVSLPSPGAGSPLQLLAGMTNEVFCQSPTRISDASPQPIALDPDDSWHIHTGTPDLEPRSAALMNGRRMVFQNAENLIVNRTTVLRFRVFNARGAPLTLQNYMGMLGHAVVRHRNGTVFTHLHPSGTVSMAAQDLLMRHEARIGQEPIITEGSSVAHEVSFPYAFPQPGAYRVWVQVRCDGRVLTGVFQMHVR